MRHVDRALERLSRLQGELGWGRHLVETSPRPHFVVQDPLPQSSSVGAHDRVLKWPSTILAIEKQHGARFEQLASALEAARRQRSLRAFLFTSRHRAEGRTTLVLTLARALARRSARVLMVDADLSGPMLARSLDLAPGPGLEEVVLEGLDPNEALIQSPDDGLAVLPLRSAVARPRGFLSHPGWSRTLEQLKRDWEFVLIDGSPLFVGVSWVVPPGLVDAAILVRRDGMTGAHDLSPAISQLKEAGIAVLGVAETFVLSRS